MNLTVNWYRNYDGAMLELSAAKVSISKVPECWRYSHRRTIWSKRAMTHTPHMASALRRESWRDL